MELLKVMIVDDEILAIKYVKNLIVWEQFGFEVVAECTNPIKAMKVFMEVCPDIIIIDIRMPGMDGLELSSKLLHSGRSIKILLLTSYRDFEYAKQAIRVGVSNYLLKHEIHSDNLVTELEKVKEELFIKRNKDKIAKRRLIKDVLEGKEFSAEEFYELDLMSKDKQFNYIFMLFKVDSMYPIANYILEHPLKSFKSEALENTELFDKISILAVITLEDGKLGVLLEIKESISQHEVTQKIYLSARRIQEKLKENSQETFSAVPSNLFYDLFDLPKIYKEINEIIKYSFFAGRGELLLPSQIKVSKNGKLNFKPVFNQLEKNLEELAVDDVISNIDELFDMVMSKQYDLEGFKVVCYELISLLGKFRIKRYMTPLEESITSGEIDIQSLNTASGIREWFREEYRKVILISRKRDNAIYSRKVQETIKFIYEHYSEDFSVNDLSEKFSVSGDHLRHLFKKETNKTISDYITFVRIEKAKQLLKSGKFKIYEISDKVGYHSSQYFSSVFKKETGVNPLEYIEGGVTEYEG